ncbi:MAG: ATP-dependent Clp protease ATP-binding subunit ClpA [Bradymonadia bacterium]
MLTNELRIAIETALQNAQHRRQEIAGTEHLFLALLHDPVTARAVKRCGGDVRDLIHQVEDFLDEHLMPVPGEFPVEPQPSLGFQEAVNRALFNAQSSERNEVAGPHVLIAMFNLKDCHSTYLLQKQGISKIELMEYVSHSWEGEDDEEDEISPSQGRGTDSEEGETESGEKANPKKALEQFTVNLNFEAAEGRIDPMVGRTKELERTIHILCRRRKNNPVFVGEAGVGKTAIVEGLALAIHNGEVPEPLQDAIIYALDVGALVAGTRYRGDFENRLKAVVKQLEKRPEAVLFVDEIHTLIGAGAASGGALDASSILKPLLARGKIRCIGATTWKEFRSIFERDNALARRFQKIDVNEPTTEETAEILRGLKSRYEEFHNVSFVEEALVEAARLAGRYLNDRRLPDKAIDVIDEAAAEVKLKGEDLVDVEAIERTLARMAQIPPKRVAENDRERLGRLEIELKGVVFGQDEAVDQLVSAIKLARSGLSHPDKPIGNFLFTGPTGVGKTEVARQLSRVLGLELIRFDMSEYMERHTVSRLIGAPPGYVGFDQGGLLTDAVSKNPHVVLLLDEIEKAHPDVFNLLLQVMDHGTLTDNNGKKADFRNVILIMTSNVGARDLARTRPGFAPANETRKGDDEEAMKRLFSPEFRNRLDARIRFAPLDPVVMGSIVDKFLKLLSLQLAERNVTIEATEAARALLAKEGYDRENGARPMDRVIRQRIKRKLADDMLFGDLKDGGHVVIDIEDDDFVMKCSPKVADPVESVVNEAADAAEEAEASDEGEDAKVALKKTPEEDS